MTRNQPCRIVLALRWERVGKRLARGRCVAHVKTFPCRLLERRWRLGPGERVGELQPSELPGELFGRVLGSRGAHGDRGALAARLECVAGGGLRRRRGMWGQREDIAVVVRGRAGGNRAEGDPQDGCDKKLSERHGWFSSGWDDALGSLRKTA